MGQSTTSKRSWCMKIDVPVAGVERTAFNLRSKLEEKPVTGNGTVVSSREVGIIIWPTCMDCNRDNCSSRFRSLQLVGSSTSGVRSETIKHAIGSFPTPSS